MFFAHGKAWNQETRKHDEPLRVEFPTKQQALDWCKFNREWMIDLQVDG